MGKSRMLYFNISLDNFQFLILSLNNIEDDVTFVVSREDNADIKKIVDDFVSWILLFSNRFIVFILTCILVYGEAILQLVSFTRKMLARSWSITTSNVNN
jgi:hypothetical protein